MSSAHPRFACPHCEYSCTTSHYVRHILNQHPNTITTRLVKGNPICYIDVKDHKTKLSACLGCLKCFVCHTKGEIHFKSCDKKQEHKDKIDSLKGDESNEGIPLTSENDKAQIEAPLKNKIEELNQQLARLRKQYAASTKLMETMDEQLKELRPVARKYQKLQWGVTRYISNEYREGLANRITIAEDNTVFAEDVYDWKDELSCYTKDNDLNDLEFPFEKNQDSDGEDDY